MQVSRPVEDVKVLPKEVVSDYLAVGARLESSKQHERVVFGHLENRLLDIVLVMFLEKEQDQETG